MKLPRVALGAWPASGGRWTFRLWAPDVSRVELELYGARTRVVEMERGAGGFHVAEVRDLAAGALYKYRVDGKGPFPDPASRSQPEGPHGPSALVDPGAYRWSDASWPGVDRDHLVIYEVHVGTATPAGTFDALIAKLPDLSELGVTAIELLPVAESPGRWNWGYDGVKLWAPSSHYGGPEALRRLVDAAHRHGLGVILDVVYNHLGPDGNYLRCYAQDYFTSKHHTPWGDALNFAHEAVREFFTANAAHWVAEYHLDGLRCDATHELWDPGQPHILAGIAQAARAAAGPRPLYLTAEDDRNDRRLMAPRARGGYEFDAVWADDLHHQLQVALAGDNDGYYRNYTGTPRAIARTLDRGWFYEGQKMPVTGKKRGTRGAGLPFRAFVHCLQNHDQIGNRALGERLHHLIEPDAWRAASVFLLLSPYTPLLYMGQEWGATTPFQYFTDHHPELGRMVTEGRRREFSHFRAFRSPVLQSKIPDPQAEATFARSKLSWEERERAPHAAQLALHREVLRLRHTLALPRRAASGFRCGTAGKAGVWYRRRVAGDEVLVVFNLRGSLRMELAPPRGQRYALAFSSEDARFGGDPGRVRLGPSLVLKGPVCVALRARKK